MYVYGDEQSNWVLRLACFDQLIDITITVNPFRQACLGNYIYTENCRSILEKIIALQGRTALCAFDVRIVWLEDILLFFL